MSDQTSRKSGVHSSSEKVRETRHPVGPTPSSRPVDGAYGREGPPIVGSERLPDPSPSVIEEIEEDVDR